MKYEDRKLESAMWLFEDILNSNIDCLFDVKESVRDLIYCIKNNPDQLIKALSDTADGMEEELIEHDICPDCGGELEWVRDGDNYVPYGDTYVVESSYGHRSCPCGFSIDD